MQRSLAIPALLVTIAGHCDAASAQSSCKACHSGAAELEHGRAHERAGIGCTACHGGDATKTAKEAAKFPATGYRGKLARKSVPELCGGCHADVRRMNPHGLPTDQLARYRTSRHGEALFEDGNEKTATCIDCHGHHGILPARSSDSPVHPRNLPATCGRCHSDPALVEDTGLDGTEEREFRASVHGRLLLDEHDLAAPECATCHDSHGAVPRGFRSVGAVCGKCHPREKKQFETSKHARLVDSGEFEACVACHGSHAVAPASDAIYERMCALCHQPGDKGMAVRDRLLAGLREARQGFTLARRRVARARRLGIATEDVDLLLENIHTAVVEIEALQHSLDPESLRSARREAKTRVGRLIEQLDSSEALEEAKRLALLPVVLFLGLVAFGSWLRFRRIHGPVPEEGR